MSNPNFGENSLYVQRCYSVGYYEANETRSYGILADRVRKAAASKLHEDSLHVNGWRAGVAADGPLHPNSIKYRPTKSQFKRNEFASFLSRSKSADLYGKKELTRTPTNPKYMERWAKDYALSKLRPFVKHERLMFKPEYKAQRNAYYELMADADTANVRSIMDEARKQVNAIEANRQGTWYPKSMMGEENLRDYEDSHK